MDMSNMGDFLSEAESLREKLISDYVDFYFEGQRKKAERVLERIFPQEPRIYVLKDGVLSCFKNRGEMLEWYGI